MRYTKKDLRDVINSFNFNAKELGLPLITLECSYGDYRINFTNNSNLSYRGTCGEMYRLVYTMRNYLYAIESESR